MGTFCGVVRQVFQFDALHQRLELLSFLNSKTMEAYLSSLLVVGDCEILSHFLAACESTQTKLQLLLLLMECC